jgi:acetyl esterase/lipase
MARDRAIEGYLYLNIDYSLAPFQSYPAGIEDIQAAINWVSANAQNYGGDPSTIGLFGFSAGGHLATLLALTSPVRIRTAVSWGGSMDYRDVGSGNSDAIKGHESCILAFLGACHHDRPDLYEKISPASYVSLQSPPILVVHGQLDPVISRYHADAMRAAAKKAIAPVDVCILPDAGHTDPGPLDPDGGRIWAYICNFLAKYLEPRGPIRPIPPEPLARI